MAILDKVKLSAFIATVLATGTVILTSIPEADQVSMCGTLDVMYEAGEELDDNEHKVYNACKESDLDFKSALDIKYAAGEIVTRDDAILVGDLGSETTKNNIVATYIEADVDYIDAYMLAHAIDEFPEIKKSKTIELVNKYTAGEITDAGDLIVLTQMYHDLKFDFANEKCLIEGIEYDMDSDTIEGAFSECLLKFATN